MLIGTAPGKLLTKTTQFFPDGTLETVRGGDNAYRWQFEEVEVRDYDGLLDLLVDLNKRPNSLVLRGQLTDHPKPVATVNGKAFYKRTLVRNDAVHGVIVDLPSRIVMIDIDNSEVVLPNDWLDAPDEWADKVISADLPEYFHGAGCVVQWSGSVAPSGGKAKVHLWFLLTRPINSATLKGWLGIVGDDAVYSANHPYYTAAPICLDANGCKIADPLGNDRVFLLEGPPVVVPSDVKGVASDNNPSTVYAPDKVPMLNPDLGGSRWRDKLDLIGDHEGGHGFHNAIRTVLMVAAREMYDPRQPTIDHAFDIVEEAIVETARKAHLSSPDRATKRDDRIKKKNLWRSFIGAIDNVRLGLLKDEEKLAAVEAMLAQRRAAWDANTLEEPWTVRADKQISDLMSRRSRSS